VSRFAVPRFLRVASFRLAALYVIVFAASALLLGAAVFLEARSAMHQHMTARIETGPRSCAKNSGSMGFLV
jgi:hypothetical protein